MKKNLFYLLLLIFFSVMAQLVVNSSFNFFSNKINLVLVLLIILINLTSFNFFISYVVAVGLMLDVYSTLPFGVLAITLFFTALMIEILFINFFTNFSFYSLLLLSVISVIIYHTILFLILTFLYFLGWSEIWLGTDFFLKFLWQIITTLILIFFSYYFINKLSKKLNPNFLN